MNQELLLAATSPVKRSQLQIHPSFNVSHATRDDEEMIGQPQHRKRMEHHRRQRTLKPLPPMVFDMQNLTSVSNRRNDDDVQQLLQQVEHQHQQRQRQRQRQREQGQSQAPKLNVSRSLNNVGATTIDRHKDIAKLWNVDTFDDSDEESRYYTSSSSNANTKTNSRQLPLDESVRNYLVTAVPSPDAPAHGIIARRLLLHLLRSTGVPDASLRSSHSHLLYGPRHGFAVAASFSEQR